MTLPEFKAEVLRHLPALRSWCFADRKEGWDGPLLHAVHTETGSRVWVVHGKGGTWWHFSIPETTGASGRTLPETIAAFRARHGGLIAVLADLSADGHHAPKTTPAEGEMEAP